MRQLVSGLSRFLVAGPRRESSGTTLDALPSRQTILKLLSSEAERNPKYG
ncbi:MAG TPA: hypothetical protein VGU63_06640 [Candidatus Acidoferrales bacterium]|nr:hypothetical protein [Candidatus Acidoferrales bacterium]